VHCRSPGSPTHADQRELQPRAHSGNYAANEHVGANEHTGANPGRVRSSIELHVCRRSGRAERWDNMGL